MYRVRTRVKMILKPLFFLNIFKYIYLKAGGGGDAYNGNETKLMLWLSGERFFIFVGDLSMVGVGGREMAWYLVCDGISAVGRLVKPGRRRRRSSVVDRSIVGVDGMAWMAHLVGRAPAGGQDPVGDAHAVHRRLNMGMDDE